MYRLKSARRYSIITIATIGVVISAAAPDVVLLQPFTLNTHTFDCKIIYLRFNAVSA
jgi:hypothetical protein